MNPKILATVVIAITIACSSSTPIGDTAATQQQLAAKPTSRAAKMQAIYDTAATLTDQEKRVPHYFGPFPNWANSPFTLPDAQVTITDPTGAGSGAVAEAVVGAGGSIAGITVVSPGANYSDKTFVTISTASGTGTGTGATAIARIDTTGFVNDIQVTRLGTGYVAPAVVIRGGTAGSTQANATATAYGRVEQVVLSNPGAGYNNPTVDFDMPDLPDGVLARATATWDKTTGAITGVIMTDPGSGYKKAPRVVIRNGTIFKPVAMNTGGTLAAATTTLSVNQVVVDTRGTGYTKPPAVVINDTNPTNPGTVTLNCDVPSPPATCALATATITYRGIMDVLVKKAGSNYVTPGGIKKFVDGLPGLGPTAANALGQYLPVAVPDTTTFPGADYYEIAVVEYFEKMHSSLPPTKLRGYVQVETANVQGAHFALPGGKLGVDKPHYLGPTIVATRNRPIRITFYNLLPAGSAGDLFLPTDSTMMGAGMGQMSEPFNLSPVPGGTVYDLVRNPHCTGLMAPDGTMGWMMMPKDPTMCFTDNRATLHLHGGNTPWISDGTPHQWLTPAAETTAAWKKGVAVRDVPDMVGAAATAAGIPDCAAPGSGCMTFYYTNQQSSRLMFYHDHSWGITRLNVYAGEAAGYLIRDEVETRLVDSGLIPGKVAGEEIPLIIQDRTFVPQANQLSWQDPTWDSSKWGGYGSLWYHHVYMPAQNPGDAGGMSAFGRWMYGPWFWPPATDAKYGPIDNPYYDATCKLDDPATWTYQTDPFCEPKLIPGTPNISAGMEQFNDTPIVNGTAYPTVTLQPKSYRFRILNAANDRFWNLQWYVADATGTEVALKASEVLAAQTDPNVFPTPDTTLSPPGPSWIQIGTEGGFLPAPAVIPPQPITWITDPTRFDVGNVDQHSLAVAPAERADVIVDFSAFAGKTLILYNDAPAAYPARVASYDYYTGAPDLSPVGAPKILPGYGPNTRTILQVKIAGTAAAPFNLLALQAAFRHQADGSGVFEAGQHPIIVGQAAYNSAYGTTFSSNGWCLPPANPMDPLPTGCDGYARINQQGGEKFVFDTLVGTPMAIPFEPKALHDEQNASSFDEFGRMQANIGVESVPATPGLQNVNLFPYTFPATETIDTTYLPKIDFDAQSGAEVKVMPIGNALDGTQIWKITHNGVDTHPIHFHAFDVQVLNRVTWDNIVIAPDANELGWKDTVRVSPLEDTIVALRPVVPKLPWELPNSIRQLNPMMVTLPYTAIQPTPDPAGVYTMASATINVGLNLPVVTGPNGNPIDVFNHVMNFGAEYVWHCHILSHEEMDMMRPVLLAYPPVAPAITAFDGTAVTWDDRSIAETAYVFQGRTDPSAPWTNIAPRLDRDLMVANGTATGNQNAVTVGANTEIRILAENKVGDWWDYGLGTSNFPTRTATSASASWVKSSVDGTWSVQP